MSRKQAIVKAVSNQENWKIKTIVAGTVVGAVTGLIAAVLLSKRAEQKGERLSISSGEGLKLGVLIAGLLRSILTLGDD